MQSSSASAAQLAAAEPEKIFGIEKLTWVKIISLGFMFFCILFNYTILRDTKVRELQRCPVKMRF